MNLLINIIVLITAFIMVVTIGTLGLLYAILTGKASALYLYNISTSFSQMGNAICCHLFNTILISVNSTNKFGNIDETTSGVLGKNKLANTLTFLGKLVSSILNKLDPDHVEKSIEIDENDSNY